MPAELPGYYFDPAKNRYFKIQANHIAKSSSSKASAKYSRQAVRAETAIKNAERRDKSLKASKNAVTVQRSELLQHPLLNFDARLGAREKSVGSIVKEHYAANLFPRYAFPTNPAQNGKRPRICGKFAIEDESNMLITLAPRESGGRPEAICYFARSDSYGGSSSDHLYPSVKTLPDISNINYIDHILSIGTSRILIWVDNNNRELDIGPRSHLNLVKADAFPVVDRVTDAAEYEFLPALGAHFVFRESINGLAASPSDEAFAMATSRSVWVMSDLRREHLLTKMQWSGEATAVQYKDANVIMYGARNGKLGLCDLRAPESMSSVIRIQHTSAVSHLRTLGPSTSVNNQILVHGLTSTSLYDLRWCPHPKSTNTDFINKHSQIRRNDQPMAHPTTPYLSFNVPETRKQNRFGLGFTYDAELNMIVGCSTDFHHNHRVSLWDASTGQLLQSPLTDYKFNAPVTCAEIVHVRCNAKSILLSTGGDLLEWCSL